MLPAVLAVANEKFDLRLQSAMGKHIDLLHPQNRSFEAESSPAMLTVLLAMANKNFDLGCDGRRCSTSN
jgi:hypothetical protein